MIPDKREIPARTRIYRFYTERLYSDLKFLRGSTFLAEKLKNWARSGIQKIEEKPTPISEIEWQNLVILDGCRYDLYKEVFSESQIDYRISLGSHSQEFVERNFSSGDWSDTVVVTANPFYHPDLFTKKTGRKLDDVFHDVFLTFSDNRKYGTGDWDSEEGTVIPDKMCRNAILAHSLYPEKKKLIHFMQPHHPFLSLDLTSDGWTAEKVYNENKSVEDYEWKMVERGVLNHSIAIRGYKRNLEILRYHLKELSESLGGRTVVTSDHGNFAGERGFYGHPPGGREEVLRKVPLHVLD